VKVKIRLVTDDVQPVAWRGVVFLAPRVSRVMETGTREPSVGLGWAQAGRAIEFLGPIQLN